MPKVKIYYKGKKIALKGFVNDFFIVEQREPTELFWEADEEQAIPRSKGGEMHIWIQGALYEPYILFVRPDWQLIIDGILYPRAMHMDVGVSNKTIELLYNDYRFICSFPKKHLEN